MNDDESGSERFTEVDEDVRKRTGRFAIFLVLLIIAFVSITFLSRHLGW